MLTEVGPLIGVALLLAAAPLRAALQGPVDDETVARIEGHLSALDWPLVSAEPNGIDDPISRARAVAERHRASVVLWLDRHDAGLRLTVAQPASSRLMVREVSAADVSAARETVAVIVRSSLEVIGAGGVIGVARPAPAVAVEAVAGAALAVDPGTVDLQPGLHASVALVIDEWRVGVEAESLLPATVRDVQTALEISRHRGGVFARVALIESLGLGLDLHASLGALAYHRSSTSRAATVTATEPVTTFAFVGSAGLALRGGWRLGGAVVGAQLLVTADAVAGAPRFVYSRAGSDEERATPWPVQPHMSLGIWVGSAN